ncbi:MAG: glycosyltransferase family 39 protein [Microgenomates group bacterium]
MRRWITYSVLLIILIVGGMLRSYNVNVWPREGATFDEFAWTFQGISILNSGTPVSWSPHAAYVNKIEYFNPQGARFTLVSPYLEHPPLFGIVAGAFAKMQGVQTFDDVTIAKIRPLALIMGVISIVAVFVLTSAVYGNVVGLAASGIYAILPTVVIGSRLVQNENFFIPLFLFALYFAYKYIERTAKNKKLITLNLGLTALLCGLLPLAKMPWIAAPLAVIGIFLFSKKWKAAFWVVLATVTGLGVWLVYGYTTDATLFTNLWKLQLARYDMAFDSLFILFRDPIIADRALVDGWIYFGWAAIVLLLVKDVKKQLPILFGFLAYMAIFVFAIPSEPLHGWYRYPFYPFLAIAVAAFFKEYLNKNYLVTALSFVVIGLSMFASSWGRVLGFSYPVFRIYLITVAVGALPGIFSKLANKKVFRLINIAICIAIVLLTIWTILVYNEQ